MAKHYYYSSKTWQEVIAGADQMYYAVNFSGYPISFLLSDTKQYPNENEPKHAHTLGGLIGQVKIPKAQYFYIKALDMAEGAGEVDPDTGEIAVQTPVLITDIEPITTSEDTDFKNQIAALGVAMMEMSNRLTDDELKWVHQRIDHKQLILRIKQLIWTEHSHFSNLSRYYLKVRRQLFDIEQWIGDYGQDYAQMVADIRHLKYVAETHGSSIETLRDMTRHLGEDLNALSEKELEDTNALTTNLDALAVRMAAVDLWMLHHNDKHFMIDAAISTLDSKFSQQIETLSNRVSIGDDELANRIEANKQRIITVEIRNTEQDQVMQDNRSLIDLNRQNLANAINEIKQVAYDEHDHFSQLSTRLLQAFTDILACKQDILSHDQALDNLATADETITDQHNADIEAMQNRLNELAATVDEYGEHGSIRSDIDALQLELKQVAYQDHTGHLINASKILDINSELLEIEAWIEQHKAEGDSGTVTPENWNELIQPIDSKVTNLKTCLDNLSLALTTMGSATTIAGIESAYEQIRTQITGSMVASIGSLKTLMESIAGAHAKNEEQDALIATKVGYDDKVQLDAGALTLSDLVDEG